MLLCYLPYDTNENAFLYFTKEIYFFNQCHFNVNHIISKQH